MEPATHIIGRQRIRLRFNGTTDALALRQQVSTICSDELPVRLSKLLDRYDNIDYVLRIPKLDVTVRLNDDGNLQETLAKAIIEQVEAALLQKLEHSKETAVSVDKSFVELLSFYLRKGHLPWWSAIKTREDFRQALAEAWLPGKLPVLIRGIKPLLTAASARERLLSLMGDEHWEAWIQLAAGPGESEWLAIKQSLLLLGEKLFSKENRAAFEWQLHDALLEATAQNLSAKELIDHIAIKIVAIIKANNLWRRLQSVVSLPHAGLQEAIRTEADAALSQHATTAQPRPAAPDDNNSKPAPAGNIPAPETESIFISNAGLVLVALYLPLFFKNIGLMQDGKLADVSRAITLLHYLIFEEADFAEFEVVLEKILCGRPLTESIRPVDDITAAEKEQIDMLLQSVIEHWSVLKNTTPAGLRHNFLLREGKLIFQNNQWELTVQKMAHDILLDYLPWNIRMIKLPWMPHLLVVKW